MIPSETVRDVMFMTVRGLIQIYDSGAIRFRSNRTSGVSIYLSFTGTSIEAYRG